GGDEVEVVLAARAFLHHELASHVSSLVGPAPGGRKGGCGLAGARPRRFTPSGYGTTAPWLIPDQHSERLPGHRVQPRDTRPLGIADEFLAR
ncbi:MAG: hypothetical protein ACHQCE_22885, partial [Streptosporangiales bacterium]